MRSGRLHPTRLIITVACVAALAACGDDDAAEAPATTEAPVTTSATTVDTTGSMIDQWTTAPSLLHPRAAHGVVATDDAIYVLGGIGEDRRPVMEVERFDGATWADIATLPGKGVNAPSVAAIDGKIYVIGGFSGTSNKPTDEVHVYDIATSTWTTAAPLPTASGGHAAVVLDGRIHVVGGGTAQSTIADHVVYDPATDTWTTAAPLSRPKGSPAVTVLDGRIWAVGGRSGSDDFGDVEIYDPATDQWTAGPEIEARGNAGAIAVCGTILVAGGQQQRGSSVLDEVLVLDGDTWRADTPLSVARAFARTVLLGDAVYVVGGSDKYGQSHATPGSATVEFATPGC
jgi:N-acetylneuraminic acid mutarotase